MYVRLFSEFLIGGDTLRVYQGNKLLFASNKDRLLPLLEYIDRFVPYHQQVTIFDKVMGNAAALLCVTAACREVYSPLGSQFASQTLDKYGIKCRLTKIVPYIQRADAQDMCPMERLSMNKKPEEFYEVIKSTIAEP